MRTRATFAILLLFAIFSCDNNDKILIPRIEGLSLYWDHEVFGNEGRRLRFAISTTEEFADDYQLIFNTSIDGKTITARLLESINKGKCPYFPMPSIADDDPNRCNATGEFWLSDKELSNGIYSLKITTPSFEVYSELAVSDELITLDIPLNDHLESSIKEVYPIPKNLLFGSVVYQGASNTNEAEEFLAYLTDLGLIETTVPNKPYRHLSVDENGYPIDNDWQPDSHLIGLLFSMNSVDFQTIFEESKKYFDQTNLDIYLYTSNGDQGFLSKTGGVTVVYAPK